MISLRLLTLITLLLLAFPAISLAEGRDFQISGSELESARNAEYWAERDRWDDAMAHAAQAKDPVVRKLFQWRKLAYSKSSFNEMVSFIRKNPDWPDQEMLKKRLEEQMNSSIPSIDIINWFKKTKAGGVTKFNDPITHNGRIQLLRAIRELGSAVNSDDEEIDRIISLVWTEGDFSASDEQFFLSQWRERLTKKDFVKRIDKLIWNNNYDAARRIMNYADKDYKRLFETRIKLRTSKFASDADINSVPDYLRDNEGLIYDRIMWRLNRGRTDDINTLLLKVPGEPEHPGKWWKIKEKLIDELIDRKKYRFAYVLAQNHNLDQDVSGYAKAEWTSGWLAFHHLKDYRSAYKHFYTMYSKVKTPISLGRSAYWAGRAAELNGNSDISDKWYSVASKFPTSFYGQIATQKLGKKLLYLPKQPVPTWEDTNRYYDNEVVRAIHILFQLGEHKLALKFLKHAIVNAKTIGEKTLIGQIGINIGRPDYSITAAKEVSKEGGPIILKANYPVVKKLKDIYGRNITEPEKALIHSIILQESVFDQNALSPAGALGLMQLMPATANDTARNLRIPYNKQKLTSDANYNIMLGSRYLQRMIENYDGSYILAIASYNGGMGNVNKWIKANGDPRKMKKIDDVIDWLEKIPFQETNNYVQRVIENTQIYRFVLGENQLPVVQTSQDITR